MPQGAVVHIQNAPKHHARGINPQLVAAHNVVIQHGAQQIIRGRNGMHIACKVQVNILHGNHLCIAAAGRTALHTHHGAK